MSARLLTFEPKPHSVMPRFEASRVLAFLTRQESARRELARMCKEHEQWRLRTQALPSD